MSATHSAVNAFHIAVVGPAIAYAGYKSYKGELEISQTMSKAIIIVGILIILFHLWRFITVSYPAYKASKNQPKLPKGPVQPEPIPEADDSEPVPDSEPTAEFMSDYAY